MFCLTPRNLESVKKNNLLVASAHVLATFSVLVFMALEYLHYIETALNVYK